MGQGTNAPGSNSPKQNALPFSPPPPLPRLLLTSCTADSSVPSPHSVSELCDVPLYSAGLSQPGGMGGDVALGAAPVSGDRILSSIAEPLKPTPTVGSDAPKEHIPMRPEPQTPRSPLDLSAGKHTESPSTFAFLNNPRQSKPFSFLFCFFSTEILPT